MIRFARLRFHWHEPRFEGRRLVIELASASAALAGAVWLIGRLLLSI
jgi:hypothetical protein